MQKEKNVKIKIKKFSHFSSLNAFQRVLDAAAAVIELFVVFLFFIMEMRDVKAQHFYVQKNV